MGNVEIFLRSSARRLTLCFLFVSLGKRTPISKVDEKEITRKLPEGGVHVLVSLVSSYGTIARARGNRKARSAVIESFWHD